MTLDNVPSIRSSKRKQRVPMVSPVLCQAIRTPEQLPALEETKTHSTISRTCRAAIPNNNGGTAALKVSHAYSIAEELVGVPTFAPDRWITQLAIRQTASSLVKGREKVLGYFLIINAASPQPKIPSPPFQPETHPCPMPMSLTDIANRQQCLPVSQLWPKAGNTNQS